MWADDWNDSLHTRAGDFGIGSTGEDATRLATVHETEDEAESNARLMVKAPELFAGLEEAAKHLEQAAYDLAQAGRIDQARATQINAEHARAILARA